MENKTIYKLRDIDFFLDFKSNSSSKVYVDLKYLVSDSSGDIVFYDTDSIVLEGDKNFKMNLDTRKAQGIDLVEGEYTFSLIVEYLGMDKTFSQQFEVQKINALLYSLKQLFDITMKIDNPVISSSQDLSANVIFERIARSFPNLKLLLLGPNVLDISVLSKLPKLEYLTLTESKITDFKNVN